MYENLSKDLDVEKEVLYAVAETETKGNPFIKDSKPNPDYPTKFKKYYNERKK